ncbi:MBL fold metallo-hydrolase [Rubellimicrobium rubrum]|uniref:MBL fold metallo-hydrolase n=1 Tax=Rubellimicrobium rubrum TaxID=2585369 RepID=A0A5C4MNU1_9RHOB|nr:MBL fold metallo-hydrolase [Rubellimicrobium rubrum]TNC46081.1 MBL fold metallo-hydrolase [Rubellimicrobium rubrum]
MIARRRFLEIVSASAGLIVLGPFAAAAQDAAQNTFDTDGGQMVVHPVSHASFVLETPGLVIYVDPVGEAAAYSQFPAPDLILLTHEHGDHFSVETLSALAGETAQLVTNPAVHGMLPDGLRSRATALANGESTEVAGITIEAIPAYNTTEDRLEFHPQGRDNGYLLGVDGRRVYIAGDTEDIPEMRALENIDVAFLPMNLPYTMDINQAAEAVKAFQPRTVYPYHYGESDVQEFASLVEASGVSTVVVLGNWYPEGPES